MTIPPGSTNSLNPEQQISSPQREDQTSEEPSRLKAFDDRNYRSPTVHSDFSDLDSSAPGRQNNPTPVLVNNPMIPPTPEPHKEIDIASLNRL